MAMAMAMNDRPTSAAAAASAGADDLPARVALLAEAPFFARLRPDSLATLARTLESQAVPQGDAVCTEGEPGDAMYLVADGAFQVVAGNGDGESVVGTLRRGDSFGEMALLADEPRTATVRAAEPSHVLKLSRDHLEMLLERNPGALRALVTLIVDRLKDSNRRMVERDLARLKQQHELEVARLIQTSLLPHSAPQLPGWRTGTYYQPARQVGGDFYDFVELPDQHLGIVVGDVTDKGVPAAIVMAAARSLLRASILHASAPGTVLAEVNDQVCRDTLPGMFATCFYAVLDAATGRLRYANAGHDVPFVRRADGSVTELRARGMPLGLMPGMSYEEHETVLAPGEHVLFYSDGLAEAHDPDGTMLGFGRVRDLVGGEPHGEQLIETLLAELARFTGPGWEQEDDITLVSIGREARPLVDVHMIAEFRIPSAPGNERMAMDWTADAVAALGLDSRTLERLKTAVAEVTMNAMEHGNRYQADLPVFIQVEQAGHELLVRVTDQGNADLVPPAETPDLDAKLAGLQTPRGWGLFLVERMVDAVRVSGDASHHTVELVLNLAPPA